MKLIPTSFFVLCSFSIIYGQALETTDFNINDFKPIPKKYSTLSRAYLIDKINPKYDYNYWEAVYKDALSDMDWGRVIVYNGDSSRYAGIAREISSDDGFFVECHPGICFTYIVGVRDNKTIDIINNKTKLSDFIGQIDNIEEVILISKLNGYWYDSDTIIGGAYKERENDYLLYLMKYSGTPVTYRSVKAILKKNGDFKVIDSEIYYQDLDTYINN